MSGTDKFSRLNRIIYGGSFDPPHQGHIDCVNAALEIFRSAIVMIVPGVFPVGIDANHKIPVANYDERLKMCEKAFSGLSERVVISDIERQLSSPNFSLKTIELVKKIYPSDRIGFLIGLDQLTQFSRWHRPREILALVTLIAIRRRAARISAIVEFNQIVQSAAEELNLQILKSEKYGDAMVIETEIGELLILDKKNICPAESSVIRDQFSHDGEIAGGWLTRAVKDLILEKKLYQVEK